MNPKTPRRSFIGGVAAIPVAATAGVSQAASAPRAAAAARMSDTPVTPWVATCVQTAPTVLGAAKSKEDARAILAKDMGRYERLISNASERRTDLALFPEYWLGGPESDLKGVLDF